MIKNILYIQYCTFTSYVHQKLSSLNNSTFEQQCLMDLENSRDDLLFELHKLPHQNPNDTRMLKEYFADVQNLSDELGEMMIR